MMTVDRTYAQALADRAAELESDLAAAADYLDELHDELRDYAAGPTSVAAIRAHLPTIEGACSEAAEGLEEARRLLAG